jgi:hypothetical protein
MKHSVNFVFLFILCVLSSNFLCASDETLKEAFLVYSQEELYEMLDAGEEMEEICFNLLRKNSNPVKFLTNTLDSITEYTQFPENCVRDEETGSMYYYHAHCENEHGHFHSFILPENLPESFPKPIYVEEDIGDAPHIHLFAISMNEMAKPQSLFTVNLFRSGTHWYKAPVMNELIKYFNVQEPQEYAPLNRWMNAFHRFFVPQIKELMIERDDMIETWSKEHPNQNAFEDEDLDLLSSISIDFDLQLKILRELVN